jgi:hypothetical protein
MTKENTIETLKNPKPQFSDEGLLPPRKPISQLEVKKMDKIIRESQPENTIEEKIKDTEFIEPGVDGFSRGKYYKISERDFRKLQKDIRRQALEEAIGCRPDDRSFDGDVVGDREAAVWNKAISDYQSNIKSKL